MAPFGCCTRYSIYRFPQLLPFALPTTLIQRRVAKMERWQQRNGAGTKEEWTRKTIGPVALRSARRQGQQDVHLNELLSGHWCFASYLHQIGNGEDPSQGPLCYAIRHRGTHFDRLPSLVFFFTFKSAIRPAPGISVKHYFGRRFTIVYSKQNISVYLKIPFSPVTGRAHNF